jgi:tRNA 2-thiocytidine biosynthesis protein TtcA
MGQFAMLQPGDRVGIGVSGGKDSMCLVDAMAAYRERAPFAFELVAVTVEQGKFTGPIESIGPLLERIDVEWILREEPRTMTLVEDGIEHGCDVCSRHRRGALYHIAEELGCTALALGHTADDCAESLFRNVMFNGRVASLPPVATSRKGGLRIIRPLVFVSETWTAQYVAERELTPVGCVCGEKDGPRSRIRAFLGRMDQEFGGTSESTIAALANVNPYTLWDADLRKEGADDPEFVRDAAIRSGNRIKVR